MSRFLGALTLTDRAPRGTISPGGVASAGPERTMNNDTEGMLAVVASLLVLFTAMVDPIISAAIAVVILASVGIWKPGRAHRA
jgi:hypothetical protein